MTLRALIGLLAILASTCCVRADENGTSDPTSERLQRKPVRPPLVFRKVYAPADRPEDWPLEPLHYWNMEPAEFERMLSMAESVSDDANRSLAAVIISGTYRARWEDDRSLVGRASLKVRHDADGPTMLTLAPCRLAILDSEWTESAESLEPAEIGLGLDNQLNVQVERSGLLEFDWSLRGRSDPFGETVFLVELPRCPSNALILELPKHLIPSVDSGIVVRGPPKPEGYQTWQIELGGHERVELRVTSVAATGLTGSAARVRESHLYNFTRYGVEVTAELRLDAEGVPLTQIALLCDGGLQLASARYGNSAIRWTTLTPSDKRGITRVVLELPEPIRGPGRVLRLGAVAPLQEDRPWRLPTFRTEGLFWEEGRATLRIPSPLIVERFTPIAGRQSRIAPLPGTQQGEMLQVQFFSPDSGVEIELSQRRLSPELDCGTAVELRGGEVTARVVAQYRLAESEQFELSADLSRSWMIDEVETIPHDALDDWNVEKKNDSVGRLIVRLAKALSPARPVSLVITARWLHSPIGKMLAPSDLTPLKFDLSRVGHRLMDLRAVPPYRLHVSGESEGMFLDPDSVKKPVLSLFGDTPQHLIEEEAAMAADLRVSLETQEPTYSAVVRSEVQVVDHSMIESYTIRCEPKATQVDRLRVHFNPARTTPLQWQLSDEENDTPIPRRLPPDDPSKQPDTTDGETWEIRLRRPQSEPFEIRAQRTSELGIGLPISLISLPDAASGRATVLIAQSGSTVLEIENHRLQPIPTQPPPANRTNAVRATFSYDPTHDLAASAERAVTIRPFGEQPVSASAWVWHSILQTRQQADGTTRHLAKYRIETAGRNQIRFTLPNKGPIDDILGVWVDQSRSSWRPIRNQNQHQIEVDLPSERRFLTISIDWGNRRQPLGYLDVLTPELPEPDIPILRRQWTVWLPPGYQTSSSVASKSLAERLLGPLGRSAYSHPFDPTRAENWSRIVRPSNEILAAENLASRSILLLGMRLDSPVFSQHPDGQTWATLFAEVSAAVSETSDDVAQPPTAEIVLLVDRTGLAQSGIKANTPAPVALTEDNALAGRAALQQSGLVLLVHPRAVLLTSVTSLARDQNQLRPTANESIWRIQPGPLAEQVRQAARDDTDRRFVRAETWVALTPLVQLPWVDSTPNGNRPADTLGWTAQTVSSWDRNGPRITVVRTATLRTFRWVSFLTVVGLTTWWFRRPTSIAALLCVWTIVAIWTPNAWIPVASGAVLGTLFCFVFRLLQRRPVLLDRLDTATRAGLLMLIASLSLSTGLAFAQPMPDTTNRKPTKAYRVFIPVDDKGYPTGGKYSVPEPVYRELHRQAAAASVQPKGWLLRSATYRGVLTRSSNPRRLTVSQFTVRFELDIFRNPGTIRIPLGRDGANLLPDGALLDGQPVQPEWQEDGNLLAVDLPDVESFDASESIVLELSLSPAVKTSAEFHAFELTIPPLAMSRLDLTIPPDAPPVDVPFAVGRIDDRRTDPSRLIAELGRTNKLSVQWKASNGSGAGRPDIEAEQLTVLRVKPGSVLVDAIWKCRADAGPLHQLHIAADARLRLLPLAPDSPVTNIQTNPGPPQTIRFDLAGDDSNETTVKASFLLTGASGVGYLNPPLLEIREARVKKRWLAVWIDPALVTVEKPAVLDEIELPAFEASWGAWEDPGLRPLFACERSESRPLWSLALRPREPITHVDQIVQVSFAPKEARVLLTAQLEHRTGYRLQYSVKAPMNLIVDRVSVREEGVERLARWSRAQGGNLSLFLNGPAGRKQTLLIEGRIPLAHRNRMPLPDIRVEEVESLTGRIGIFRREAVEVKLINPRGLTETEAIPGVSLPKDFGRPVKWYDLTQDEPVRAQVSLVPNRPKVHATQATVLRFDGEYWEAEVGIRLDVRRGLLDRLRLEIPGTLAEPYQIEPSTWRISVENGLDKSRRRLTLEPPEALTGSHEIIITGSFTLPPSDRLRVGHIRLKEVSTDESYLVLPAQSDFRPLSWETQGLARCEFPDVMFPDGMLSDLKRVDRDALVAYRAEGHPSEAVLRPVVGTAQVLASEVVLGFQADGSCHGQASFDLKVGRLTEIDLQMSTGYRPIHATVAGVTVLPIPSGANRWRLALGPGVLPQRVEVVFSGKLSKLPDGRMWRCSRPKLLNLPDHETLWTVSGPTSDHSDHSDHEERTEALTHAMARLDGLGRLLESAGEMTLEGHERLDAWYLLWAGRWQDARREVEQVLVDRYPDRNDPSYRTILDELSQLDAVPETVANRLGTSDEWRRLSDDAAEVNLAACPLDVCSARYIISPAESDSISIDLESNRSNFPDPAVMATLGLVMLLVLTAWSPTRRWIHKGWRRWPHVVCVLAGFGWWLWMWPSVLGLLLICASLVSAFRSPWSKKRKSASAVVPIHSFNE